MNQNLLEINLTKYLMDIRPLKDDQCYIVVVYYNHIKYFATKESLETYLISLAPNFRALRILYGTHINKK
jgi:hypothetical protein